MDRYSLRHSEFFRRMAELYIDDIPDARMAEQPGGLTNHPAWIIGHLVSVHDFFLSLADPSFTRDEAWREKYGGGSTPTTNRADYPAKKALVDRFNRSARKVRELVENMDEAALGASVPDERINTFFGSMGQFAVHVMIAERAFHIGQLSAWRRAAGLESVFANPERASVLIEA